MTDLDDTVAGVSVPDTSPTHEATEYVLTAAHPRPDFKRRILRAFSEGVKHRPDSTFGTVNADVLAHYDPSFVRGDFVETILGNSWSE